QRTVFVEIDGVSIVRHGRVCAGEHVRQCGAVGREAQPAYTGAGNEEKRPAGGSRIVPQVPVDRIVSLQHQLARVERHGQAHVASAIGEIGADDAADLVFEALAVLGNAHLRVEFDALEVSLEDEVGDPGYRVRAVGGRSAAGDDLDTLESGVGNRRNVDHACGIGGGAAAAVDQHQAAVRADAA